MAKRVAKKEDKPSAKVVAIQSDNEAVDAKLTILQQAAAAEKNDDLALAEKLYKKQMHQKAFNDFVYKRLMIIYRKQKRYKDELEIINKGLKHFEEHRTKQSSKKNISTSIKRLSSSLNKSLGLTNSKGKLLYEPEPIPSWEKRKEVVEKKLKKN